MTDIVTPRFAQRVANGDIILNPMTMSDIELDASGGSWGMQSSNAQDKYSFTGNYLTAVFGPPQILSCTLPVSQMITYCQTKALASVRPTDFQGLVAAAEFRKTLRMLANPVSSLASLVDYVSRLRKGRKNLHIDVINGELRRINGRTFRVRWSKAPAGGRFNTVPKSSIVVPFGDAISGSVLAHNLGLKPLLSDIEQIFKEIPQAHQLARGTFRCSSSEDQTLSASGSIAESVFTHNGTLTTTHKVKVRTTIIAADTFNVLQDFGLSFADVPEALWEVIPYSFLVDYVINVGDVLSAIRAQSTQNVLGSATVVSIESESNRVITGTTSSSAGWVVTSGMLGTQRYKVTTKNRSIGLDRVGLAILPRSKIVTPSHIQNVLSLTVQQLIGLNSKKPKTFY